MENPFEVILKQLDRIEEKLSRLEQSKADQDELLDIETLGKYINYQKTSIYGLVQKNKIPYIKRGKLFFRKVDIDNWLNQGKQVTKEDIRNRSEEYVLKRRLG